MTVALHGHMMRGGRYTTISKNTESWRRHRNAVGLHELPAILFRMPIFFGISQKMIEQSGMQVFGA